MKKVLIIVGSARKKGTTYQACTEFEKELRLHGEIEAEYVFLSDYNLVFCNGCMVCFNNGEQLCPLKDDRDILIQKMEQADGVLIATPNYSFQVSARVKTFLDRIAYLLHRPKFFNKAFTAIVTEGVMKGRATVKYLQAMGNNMGFNVTKGCSINTLGPMSDKQIRKLAEKSQECAKRFTKELFRSNPKKPTLFKLMMFRFVRSGIKNAKVKLHDYSHYEEKGWFTSDYYYEVKLNPLKRLAGKFFDVIGSRLFK